MSIVHIKSVFNKRPAFLRLFLIIYHEINNYILLTPVASKIKTRLNAVASGQISPILIIIMIIGIRQESYY